MGYYIAYKVHTRCYAEQGCRLYDKRKMAIWNRKKPDKSQSNTYADEEKVNYQADATEYPQNGDVAAEAADAGQTRLHRGLKARHITMIAIGGAIGTGLIIGTGAALAKAGPGSILISYTFVGLIVFLVMAALGEMAAWLPLGEGFAGYATRFCDPALGFALGYVSLDLCGSVNCIAHVTKQTYWFKYIIVTPNQLTAAALVIQYWCPPG